MVLPLYLAMTEEEMAQADRLPRHCGIFDPSGGIPPEAMLILTDRLPLPAPREMARQIRLLRPGMVLLDFERRADRSAQMVADALFDALPCPVAAPPEFTRDSRQPVFLPLCPLQTPLAEYLSPWKGREIWLETAMQQQTITVTRSGTRYGPATPADRQEGTFDNTLMCRCITEISEDAVRFTLFDTPDTLKRKLNRAAKFGITTAVGLYQELHDIL